MAFLNDYIERWRHTRGYGVHSPLAYRIVKDCVRPDMKYGFYTDAYLDFNYHEDRKGLENARMVIRLVNLLRPKRIWMPGGDKRICTALRISFPNTQLATQKECPKNVDFIIFAGNEDCQEMWEKMRSMADCGMLVLGRNDDLVEGPTLTIEGRDFVIFLKRNGMERVKYKVL